MTASWSSSSTLDSSPSPPSWSNEYDSAENAKRNSIQHEASTSSELDSIGEFCDWSDVEDMEQIESLVHSDAEFTASSVSESLGSSCSWSEDDEKHTQSEFVIQSPSQSVLREGNSKSSLPDFIWTPPPETPSRSSFFANAESSLRRSPRAPKVSKKFAALRDNFHRTPNNQFSADKWDLFHVMELNGCCEHCTTKVHGMTEYDILMAHSAFTSMNNAEQRRWMYDYFTSHCPNDENGAKEPSRMQFFLCGKAVCQPLWLASLAMSTSRFYDLRKQFMEGSGPPAKRKSRSLASKSLKTISWMTSYFERIGDKRPDKEGIYLPTCLTEFAIYSRMVEEIGDSEAVCFSQFNKIYRQHFSNVTIPKVTESVHNNVNISINIELFTCFVAHMYIQECRFTKCNFCTLVKNEIYKTTVTSAEKVKLRALLDDHLKLQE